MWYFMRNEERQGPFEPAEMQARVRSGEIGPSTPVWRESMADWTEAGSTELFQAAAGGAYQQGPGTPPPPGAPYTQGPTDPAGQTGDTTLPVMTHILGLLTGFLGPLIVYLVATEANAKNHAREALNWQLSLLLYGILSAVLVLVVVGIFAIIALAIMDIVFCIMAAVKAGNRDFYRYPLTIRFLS